MTTTTPGPAPLTDAEVQALREAVTEAVLSTPVGLRDALADDPDASLRLVAATRVAAEETSRLLREAVAGARSAGHRWDTLGTLLGVSKQAAQQRFATPTRPDPHVGDAGAPERKVLSPSPPWRRWPSWPRRAGTAGTSWTTAPSSTSWKPPRPSGSTTASPGPPAPAAASKRRAGPS